MTVLKHIGILSLAKIFALFGLVMGLIYGILFSWLAIAFVSVMPGMSAPPYAGPGLGIAVILLMAIAGALGGLVYGAVLAFLYNVFAGWVGGIELDFS